MEQLSIGAVARMTGLSEFTLRAWERRYEGLRPKRLKSGRRVYSLAEVEKLNLLGKLTASGISVSDIIGLETAALAELVQLERGAAIEDSGSAPGINSARMHADNFLAAVKDLDVGRLSSLLRRAQMQFNTRSFLLDIVVLFLRDLGEAVRSGQLDVFHEHAASAVVRNFLTGILFSAEQPIRMHDTPPVVFAAPEGDHHEFGILIAALLATLRSKKVFYLGANVPFGSLERAARMTKSPLIVVGVAAPESSLSKGELNDYVGHLARRLRGPTEIWVGGPRVGELKKSAEGCHIKTFSTLNEFDRALHLMS